MSDYGKGYAAGRRRRKRDGAEDALWQRAFVAAIPACFAAEGWTRGDKPIRTLAERMTLAGNAADLALAEARRRGRV